MLSFLSKFSLAVLYLLTVILLPAQAGVIYFHNDPVGSPLVGTDEDGNVIAKETYYPYGERYINAPGTEGNTVWFAGKSHDADTGLSYFGARYYSPVLGRFTGVDPVSPIEGKIHSLNRYAYANNNPYKYVDPDGRLAFLIPVAAFAGKELLGEALSYASGGLTDYLPLSTRRFGTTVVKEVAGNFTEKRLAKAVREGIKDLPSVSKGGFTSTDKHVAAAIPGEAKIVL